jgi:murein L,D-transpeptidase YcbB/YkuD
LILYATALATEDGQVMFFDDIYGHDRKLEKLLGLPPPVAAKGPM